MHLAGTIKNKQMNETTTKHYPEMLLTGSFYFLSFSTQLSGRGHNKIIILDPVFSELGKSESLDPRSIPGCGDTQTPHLCLGVDRQPWLSMLTEFFGFPSSFLVPPPHFPSTILAIRTNAYLSLLAKFPRWL